MPHSWRRPAAGCALRLSLIHICIDPNVPLSTYSDDGIDIIRCEAQSAIRSKHFWLYSGSEDSAAIKTTFPDKVPSNCAINAVDIPYRFMGVSTWLNQIRLYQNAAVGGNLDWCIVGAFEDYPDRANFEGVSEAFHPVSYTHLGCQRNWFFGSRNHCCNTLQSN